MRPRSATYHSPGNTDGCFAVAAQDKSSCHWRNDFDGIAITRVGRSRLAARESVHRKDSEREVKKEEEEEVEEESCAREKRGTRS